MPPTDAEDVFTAIFEAHRPAVYSYLLGRVGEPELARDLLQETFLRVWRRLDEIRGLPPPRRQAWIFTVTRNLVTDSYRARSTRAATVQELATRVPPTAGALAADQPAAHVERNELVHEVAAAIRTLPADLRVILSMHAVGELTSVQIGAALGLPPGTVRYKLSRARRVVAAALDLDSPSLQEARR
jgi:RNA polymerase sigma-70 factor, ECF subfamily